PAAAAGRAVATIRDLERRRQEALAALAASGASSEQLAGLVTLGARAVEEAAPGERLDPLARSDREQELADGLERRGVGDAFEVAAALTDAGLGGEWIARVAAAVGEERLPDGLRFVGACAGTRVLLGELE